MGGSIWPTHGNLHLTGTVFLQHTVPHFVPWGGAVKWEAAFEMCNHRSRQYQEIDICNL